MKVYIRRTNVISPLGVTTEENLDRILTAERGVMPHPPGRIHPDHFHASLCPDELPGKNDLPADFSRYEQLIAASLLQLMGESSFSLAGSDTLFLFSSTKGNISNLEEIAQPADHSDAFSLAHSAQKIADFFNHPNTPQIISNACISGVAAILYGKRIIELGQYRHVVICGADLVSRFVYSGFHSFQALSPTTCKPFSADRDGINLGEAAASMLISADPPPAGEPAILIKGGAITNDANHISGPSRTGIPLARAIQRALEAADCTSSDIDFISAHGTATPYNDQMEAQAIHLAGLAGKPVHSLKGVYGHTLGAAGLVESSIGIQALQDNWVLPSIGYTRNPMEPELVITSHPDRMDQMRAFVKTASGFGGCNAALVFSKQY